MPSKRVRSWDKGVVKIHSPNSLQGPNNHRIIQNMISLVSPKVTDKPMKKIIEIRASFQLKLWPHYSLLHLDWELRFLIDFYDLWIINDIHSSVIVNWFKKNPYCRNRQLLTTSEQSMVADSKQLFMDQIWEVLQCSQTLLRTPFGSLRTAFSLSPEWAQIFGSQSKMMEVSIPTYVKENTKMMISIVHFDDFQLTKEYDVFLLWTEVQRDAKLPLADAALGCSPHLQRNRCHASACTGHATKTTIWSWKTLASVDSRREVHLPNKVPRVQ